MFVFRSQLFQGEPLLQAIADDVLAPDGGLTRISPVQNRQDPVVKKVQQGLLTWRPDCLPLFGADGDFSGESAGSVHRFKVEELGVPEAEVIDDVGPLTVQRLDAILCRRRAAHPTPGRRAALLGPQVRLQQSRPGGGVRRPQPPRLGRRRRVRGKPSPDPRPLRLLPRPVPALAAASPVGWSGPHGGSDGRRRARRLPPPESFVTQTMVRIGRHIFFDLAWLHEALLDNEADALRLAELHDRFVQYAAYEGTIAHLVHRGPVESYGAALRSIASDDPLRIAAGNRMLLANEHWSVIQPHYDAINASDEVGMFMLTRTLVEPVHPYHRSFLESQPQGDVRFAKDRWEWITQRQGMLENWVAAGEQERTRLVTLPFTNLLRRDFGEPGRPDLLPPGSQ